MLVTKTSKDRMRAEGSGRSKKRDGVGYLQGAILPGNTGANGTN